MSLTKNLSPDRSKLFWSLAFVWGMIFFMVLIGGATRLTGSGLSMAEWRPLFGWIPPHSHEEWTRIFTIYQATPEFLKINTHFTLEEFKSIFWLEYIHRVWGRLIGFSLLLPTILVWRSPRLEGYRLVIGLLWILGLAQGGMGWYMVKSGLIANPHVSPLRLAAHLLLAAAILTVLTHALLRLRGLRPPLSKIFEAGRLPLPITILTIFYGALVAGTKAGWIYNEFPLMGGSWIPEDILSNSNLRIWLFDPTAVQWAHRVLATLTFGYLLYWALRLSKQTATVPQLQWAPLGLASIIMTQYILGILTLLNQVPLFYGVAHQGTAFLVLTFVYINAVVEAVCCQKEIAPASS